MSKTETPEATATPAVSQKRQLTATVTSTAVTVLLGLAANIAIAKVGSKVHDQIVPKPKTETNE